MLSPPSLIQHHRQPAGGGKALEGLENRSGAAILKPVEWRHQCGSGGTGRRARLRILWPKGRGGSNPSSRTSSYLIPCKTCNFVGFAAFLNDSSEANRGKALRIEERKMCHSVPVEKLIQRQ